MYLYFSFSLIPVSRKINCHKSFAFVLFSKYQKCHSFIRHAGKEGLDVSSTRFSAQNFFLRSQKKNFIKGSFYGHHVSKKFGRIMRPWFMSNFEIEVFAEFEYQTTYPRFFSNSSNTIIAHITAAKTVLYLLKVLCMWVDSRWFYL